MKPNQNVSNTSLPNVNQGGATSLPTRAEKTIHVDPSALFTADDVHVVSRSNAIDTAYQDYVVILIPGRGGAPGVYDPFKRAEYRFLINPSEVQVTRQTLDEQSFARGGWQFGVWGEDFLTINLSGKTPGKYFQYGLDDIHSEYTASWRNLMALELVFENNGYWFEGESYFSQLNNTGAQRRIKMHQDLQLVLGEFIWEGMFQSLEIIEDADSPYLVDFHLTFIAWKERFRTGTPYPNSIDNAVSKGHTARTTVVPSAPPASSGESVGTMINDYEDVPA